jgi:hypothetical protein
MPHNKPQLNNNFRFSWLFNATVNPAAWLWQHADMGCAAVAVLSSKQTICEYSINLYNVIIFKQDLYWHTKNSQFSYLGNVFKYSGF